MSWERPPGPRGYEWSFVALEYHELILNRTYKIFVGDDVVAGAIVRGWLPSSPTPTEVWLDPEFYPRERILRRYEGLDIRSDEFARHNYWSSSRAPLLPTSIALVR